MRFVGENDSLRERFDATVASGEFAADAQLMLAPTEREQAEQVTRVAAKLRDDELHGQKSGSIESVIKSSAAATKEAQGSVQDKAEKQAKQRAEDMMFLSLLQDRITAITEEINFLEDQAQKLGQTIDGMLNGTVSFDDALEQDHVKRAIREWESRNPGRKFDPEAENADDLLLAIMEEQAQIDTANVKGLSIEREALRSTAQEAVQRAAAGEPVEAIEADIMERHPAVYATSQAVATETRPGEELADAMRDNQDEHRDDKAISSSSVDNNESGFGAMISADLNAQFETATAMPDTEQTPQTTPAIKPDMGMPG